MKNIQEVLGNITSKSLDGVDRHIDHVVLKYGNNVPFNLGQKSGKSVSNWIDDVVDFFK